LGITGCDGSSDGGQAPADAGVDAEVQPDEGCAQWPSREPRAVNNTVYVEALGDGQTGTGTVADPFRDLQDAIDAAEDDDLLSVAAGTYTAEPSAYADPTCGNCLNPADGAQTSVGFVIQGKTITIQGAGRSSTLLVTGAGYGVLVEDSDVALWHLAITGGVRAEDGNATDAAVVVRRSGALIENVLIEDNNDLRDGPDTYPGIAGVVGREESDITVLGSIISGNSWDGVALYRGAAARIVNNEITGGNGAGVGVTWDAEATVINNRVSAYWKGIGSFGTSNVVVHNNFVFWQLGWGIIASGDSTMDIANNVVADNGNCGLVVWDWDGTTSGRIVNNIVYRNGVENAWVCPGAGIVLGGFGGGVPAGWTIAYNDSYANTDGDFVYWDGASAAGVVTEEDLVGTDGNLSDDPDFVGTFDFRLDEGSPCIDAGDPAVLDVDCSPSDLGGYGGPDAEREW